MWDLPVPTDAAAAAAADDASTLLQLQVTESTAPPHPTHQQHFAALRLPLYPALLATFEAGVCICVCEW